MFLTFLKTYIFPFFVLFRHFVNFKFQMLKTNILKKILLKMHDFYQQNPVLNLAFGMHFMNVCA